MLFFTCTTQAANMKRLPHYLRPVLYFSQLLHHLGNSSSHCILLAAHVFGGTLTDSDGSLGKNAVRDILSSSMHLHQCFVH